MSATLLEAFLAKIYVNEDARASFLADPRGEAIRAGLSQHQADELVQIDRVGLDLMAESLRRKRERRGGSQTGRHR
ncbi:MAG TPA: hypothetical protein VJH03_06130 [Blastocatellia bacterium]|nr:hypothetical protein [Blastocatellia bacterium]